YALDFQRQCHLMTKSSWTSSFFEDDATTTTIVTVLLLCLSYMVMEARGSGYGANNEIFGVLLRVEMPKNWLIELFASKFNTSHCARA
ncbi:hypothetical protein R6Q59_028253, partial [Mikania micrantha]